MTHNELIWELAAMDFKEEGRGINYSFKSNILAVYSSSGSG
jgi:hypothetical protein